MCLKYRESGTRAQLQQLSLHSSPHPEAFSSILCLFSLCLLHATIHPSSSSSTTTFFFFCYLLLFYNYFNLLLLRSSLLSLTTFFLFPPSSSFPSDSFIFIHSSFSSTLFLFLFFHLLLPFSSFIFHSFLSLQSQSHPSASTSCMNHSL